MFTRVVELISKQGKARELSSAINEKIVPILKKQAGFVDEIVLVSDADSNRVLALSFWKTREDAERYQREQYNSVRETLQPLLEAERAHQCKIREGDNIYVPYACGDLRFGGGRAVRSRANVNTGSAATIAIYCLPTRARSSVLESHALQ